MSLLSGLTFILFSFSGFAQFYFSVNETVPVKENSTLLRSPWAGGLNTPQFSAVDLNGDGIKDLFVFDREANTVLTFLNEGSPNTVDYIYAREYQSIFPEMENWALLVDFNCDGLEDIYTSRPTGVRVFKASLDTANRLQYELFQDILYYDTVKNIYISSIDIPAFVDVNFDGDVDVLTFDILGGFMDYFENLSVERGYGCDSLIFEKVSDCWGEFFESGASVSVELGFSCKGGGADPPPGGHGQRHSGSTILAVDTDGDQDLECILGDVSFQRLNLLINGGSSQFATMVEQDDSFPIYNEPVVLWNFPAAFQLDVNNDDILDILVAPNSQSFSENFSNVLYYKNIKSNINQTFSYQHDRFLVEDMIDVGSGPTPVFFDHNSDGLQDLVIGNYGYFNSTNGYIAHLALYENTGTAGLPVFELIDRDYVNISSLLLRGIAPTFGDLDNDGDEDMILGDLDGLLHYFENSAGPGNTANFELKQANYQDIDVGQFSTPQLIDMNRDGTLDLVIGERNGNLNYYENLGSPKSPQFFETSKFFGEVNVRKTGDIVGYSAPFVTTLDSTGKYFLLVGRDRGSVYLYGNLEENLDGKFTLLDSMFSGIRISNRTTLHGKDINNDGQMELVIGNFRGGLMTMNPDPGSLDYDSLTNLYDSLLSVGMEPVTGTTDPDGSLNIYPNPANQIIHIAGVSLDERAEIEIYNALGARIYRNRVSPDASTVSISSGQFEPGLYFLRITSNGTRQVAKFVIQR